MIFHSKLLVHQGVSGNIWNQWLKKCIQHIWQKTSQQKTTFFFAWASNGLPYSISEEQWRFFLNQANYRNFPTVQHAFLKRPIYHLYLFVVPAQRRKRSWKTAGAPRFRDSRFMMAWSQSCLGSMPNTHWSHGKGKSPLMPLRKKHIVEQQQLLKMWGFFKSGMINLCLSHCW